MPPSVLSDMSSPRCFLLRKQKKFLARMWLNMRNVLCSIPAVPHFTALSRQTTAKTTWRKSRSKSIKHRVIYVITIYGGRYIVASSSSHLLCVWNVLLSNWGELKKVNNILLPAVAIAWTKVKINLSRNAFASFFFRGSFYTNFFFRFVMWCAVAGQSVNPNVYYGSLFKLLRSEKNVQWLCENVGTSFVALLLMKNWGIISKLLRTFFLLALNGTAFHSRLKLCVQFATTQPAVVFLQYLLTKNFIVTLKTCFHHNNVRLSVFRSAFLICKTSRFRAKGRRKEKGEIGIYDANINNLNAGKYHRRGL